MHHHAKRNGFYAWTTKATSADAELCATALYVNSRTHSVFAARGRGIKDIVLTGNLTTITPIRRVFEGLGQSFGVRFVIPDNASFGTVIGAALYEG